MSMQLDGTASLTPDQKKRSQEKEARKRHKKRKRTEQHPDQASPTKKQKSKKVTSESQATEQAAQLVDTAEASPFIAQTTSLYLPLSPISQQYPLQGLCAEHLSPLILSYYPPLDGVVLSYSNPKLSLRPPEGSDSEAEEPILAQSVDEYAVSFVWVTADFLVFRPRRGCRIEGWINLQNEGNIGLVCYNFFSASIERKRLPKDWKWIRGGTSQSGARKSKQLDESGEQEQAPQLNGFGHEYGHFVDENGIKVEGSLTFTVKNMETSRVSDREPTYVSIQGTLLSDAEENELREQDFIHLKGRSMGRLGAGKDVEYSMTGALSNGHVNSDSEIERTPNPRNRVSY